MSLYDDALAVLTRWHPRNDEQRTLQTAYRRHLEDHPDGLLRSCHPDHITASTLVVSADRDQVLLSLHRRFEIWVQFGGHCEPTDATLVGAALREASEESGIVDLRLLARAPVQLSTHPVRCGPMRPSHHLDVRYVAVAPAHAVPTLTDESIELRWFPRTAPPIGIDVPLRELIEWAHRL
ncbi:MAG: NUDIX domain-containing protein [Propionibacteriales bacterium]|nr:NUDIX domain-containing protein [Propionibacteriales bacterium]